MSVFHERYGSILSRLHTEGKLHHAYLVVGHGLETLGADIERVFHPCEIITLSTHESSSQKSVSIQDVREVIKRISTSSFLQRIRVITIQDVSLLTLEAANALLKVLEEPPNNVVFFLGARDIHLVLQTVRSRCHVLWLPLRTGERSGAVRAPASHTCDIEHYLQTRNEPLDMRHEELALIEHVAKAHTRDELLAGVEQYQHLREAHQLISQFFAETTVKDFLFLSARV